MVDVCFRLREAGWAVVSEPRAKVGLPVRSAQAWAPPALSTPSSIIGDLLCQRWLNSSIAQHSPLVAGVAAIVAQVGEFRDELEAVCYLREAGYVVAYVSGERPVEAGDAKILKNAGAIIRSKMGESGEAAPTLVFIASKNEVASALSGKTKKAKVVAGLADLKRLLRFNFMLSEVN